MDQIKTYRAGLDIGSTTAKIALLDQDNRLVFSDYQRHHAKVYKTVLEFFYQIMEQEKACCLDLKLTGSAALGTSKKTGTAFVQEVIATHQIVKKKYPDVKTAMDIGGEDSKIIFFKEGKPPDIRMNGSCAGGTGSFIDQMATLLGITPFQLNDLARDYDHIYPVASRCGVFAKTDVQSMFSRNIPHTDIAASIFHAVAVQCINSLARGMQIHPKILLCGGVFTFLPELVNMFLKVLKIPRSQMIMPERSELIPAMGAAMFDKYPSKPLSITSLIELFENSQGQTIEIKDRIDPLFENKQHFLNWKKTSGIVKVTFCDLANYKGEVCFLGVDSGSTTTKIVVIGEEREILFSWYENNSGNSVKTAIKGLLEFRKQLEALKPDLKIVQTAVTGYGEDLLKAAFNMDHGIVETIAHFTAARFVDPDVSFILDIGGQDMKAIFIDHGVINRIEVNEACSSGCGSFLETLAGSLKYNIKEFARMACDAKAPCDLGTRCTVFMNSKIKQALRENATVEDISAGLSYSVVKNCLFKVLKLQSMSDMGDHIVLQGGTFKNPSIVRVLEKITGKQVGATQIPELMGAFGTALTAFNGYASPTQTPAQTQTKFAALSQLEQINNYQTRQMHCKGCENDCRITRFDFPNGKNFFSGNKCEKFYYAKGKEHGQGFDFVAFKNDLIFNRDLLPHKDPVITIGIPRTLNTFKNFVFWHALFTACGINIQLSSPSTVKMSEKGLGTLMSDNICFPAKLVHGHIQDLLEKKVDRIFFPIVMYEKNEYKAALNAYNCPIVSSYADVVASAIQPQERFGVPLDKPVVNFNDDALLKKTSINYLRQFGIKTSVIKKGFDTAIKACETFKAKIDLKGSDYIKNARENNTLLIVLTGRPYHLDSLINHKIPEILTQLGADIITEDAIPISDGSLEGVQVLTQWANTNQIYNAARWVARQPDNIQLVQLNSFGCGPDAVVIDEVREILRAGHKNHTLVKVDEISNSGSIRLRLRSMVASLTDFKEREKSAVLKRKPFLRFRNKDRKRTIWAPFFAEDYSSYLPPMFKVAGYDFKILPRPDRESVDIGLEYANNDICYPGVVVVGDVIKALKKERYHPKDIAIGITQTGGQCRSSNYLSLIRKAMINAGFEDIPVISVTASGGLVDQPGFQMNWLTKIKLLFFITMYADCIAKMYYAVAAREKTIGHSQKVRQHYMKIVKSAIVKKNYSRMLQLLKNAVKEFNEIPVHKKELPKMGVVGESYAKYNYFANQDLVHWLIRQGIEPVLPPMVDYFIQDLVNYKENIKAGIRKKKLTDLLGAPIDWMITASHEKIQTIFSQFKYGLAFDDIRQMAKDASQILSMTNQFGEGWLIPGEIAALSKQNVHHVISVQPFGCIANHIISKGVETKIKAVYPEMNLFYLDFDAGMSEANVRNRLHFMIENM